MTNNDPAVTIQCRIALLTYPTQIRSMLVNTTDVERIRSMLVNTTDVERVARLRTTELCAMCGTGTSRDALILESSLLGTRDVPTHAACMRCSREACAKKAQETLAQYKQWYDGSPVRASVNQ